MTQRLQTYSEAVIAGDGTRYRVHAEGERDPAGTWRGWLVFQPETVGPTLRTDRETTQPELEDLEYWASGLEAVYLEGALARARPA
jgi:hypothetical protein